MQGRVSRFFIFTRGYWRRGYEVHIAATPRTKNNLPINTKPNNQTNTKHKI